MDFNYSAEQRHWLDRLATFFADHVLPAKEAFAHTGETGSDWPWKSPPVLAELQAKAKAAGLWNLFLPPAAQAHAANGFAFDSPGLSNLVYAPLAEMMGRYEFASRIFNCSPPDTGNMELLLRYGSAEQQERWLVPLMEGTIRSAFLMTEPDVASSDATNIETRIERDGDHWIINGRKWWSTGTGDADCKVLIVMGKSAPDAPTHAQQSQILVPIDTPGVTVKRMLGVFGYEDRPAGHGEVLLENVRVPAENLILGEGRGFEIAQGRLGPGRIHHCMRTIGAAEEALDLMCARLSGRTTFGKALAERSVWQERIAWARTEIDMARLLTLRTAQLLDENDARDVRADISKIKLAVPRAALKVIDDAIQAHGGGGVCSDFDLARLYAKTRTMRIVDGPDEVHTRVIARAELTPYRRKGPV